MSANKDALKTDVASGGMLTEEIERDRRFATTLARGLSVLRAFHASDDGLGNLEISKRTGLPKSTVSRLSFTLTSLGYLHHSRRNDRYRLGPASLALGNVASATMPFVSTSNSIMQNLADETATLVCMAVKNNNRMLLAKTWRPRRASSVWLDVGHRIPIIGSSSGHAYLASLPQSQFEAAIPQMMEFYDRTEQELLDIRRNSFEQLMGKGFVIACPHTRFSGAINAVSVAFRTREFAHPVSFTCGATPLDLPDHRMNQAVGPALKRHVEKLEMALGVTPALLRMDM